MEYSNVYYDGLTDRTKMPTRVKNPVGYPLVIGMFRRGIMYRIMEIHLGNIDAVLGYDPDNHYYQIVLDFLLEGVEIVNVMRVAKYSTAYYAIYSDILPKKYVKFDTLYSDILPQANIVFDNLYSNPIPKVNVIDRVLTTKILGFEKVDRVLQSKKFFGFEKVERILTTLMYPYIDTMLMKVATNPVDIIDIQRPIEVLNINGVTPLDIISRQIVKQYNQPNEDILSVSFTPLNIISKTVVISHHQPNEDSLTIAFQPLDIVVN